MLLVVTVRPRSYLIWWECISHIKYEKKIDTIAISIVIEIKSEI